MVLGHNKHTLNVWQINTHLLQKLCKQLLEKNAMRNDTNNFKGQVSVKMISRHLLVYISKSSAGKIDHAAFYKWSSGARPLKNNQ